MSVQWYPVNTNASKVEDILHEIFNGEHHVIAVEVFDHEDARNSDQLGADIGPWLVGDAVEVYEELKQRGLHDFAVQYELGRE